MFALINCEKCSLVRLLVLPEPTLTPETPPRFSWHVAIAIALDSLFESLVSSGEIHIFRAIGSPYRTRIKFTIGVLSAKDLPNTYLL